MTVTRVFGTRLRPPALRRGRRGAPALRRGRRGAVLLGIASITFATALAAARDSSAARSMTVADPGIDAVGQARQQFDAGRYADAIRILDATVADAPRDAAAYFWLGRARYELRDYAGAMAALERGVELSPDESEYH